MNVVEVSEKLLSKGIFSLVIVGLFSVFQIAYKQDQFSFEIFLRSGKNINLY